MQSVQGRRSVSVCEIVLRLEAVGSAVTCSAYSCFPRGMVCPPLVLAARIVAPELASFNGDSSQSWEREEWACRSLRTPATPQTPAERVAF